MPIEPSAPPDGRGGAAFVTSGRKLTRMRRPGAGGIGRVGGRLLSAFALVAAVLALAAAPALASLADEVGAGRQLAQQLDAGTTSCAKLGDADFEHLGEYAMDRMLGSRGAHQAMNDRMSAMMGNANTERMHELLGRRYAGCGTAGASAGPGMMGAGGSAMMGSRDLDWMRNGAWQHMSRADRQRIGASWMGPRMMSPTGGDG